SGSSSRNAVNPNAVYIDPTVLVSGIGSEASPFRSWAEVSFQPGYSYLQKRGTVARESIILNASGTASQPITIGAYGTGARPIIQGSEVETGWTFDSGEIYRKEIALEPDQGLGLGMAAEVDGTVLHWYQWDGEVDSTFSGASAGSYSFDPVSNTSYVWSTDGDSPNTKGIELSRRLFGIRGENVSHIRVENIHVRYVSLHGISFEDAKHIAISGSEVEKLGGAVIAPGPLYAGNGIEFGNSSSHGSVTNSVISEIFDSGVSPQTYSSNQQASDFLFSNLTISRSGFAGVEVAVLYNGGMTNSHISNVIVRNVTVTDSGKGWSGQRYGNEGRGIKIEADLVDLVEVQDDDNSRSISGVILEDCNVSGSVGEGIFIGGNAGTVTVRRCTVRDNEGTGILAQERETTTLLLDMSSTVVQNNGVPGLQYNVPAGQGLRVRHSTFYDNNSIGLYISKPAEDGSPIHSGEAVLTNNVFDASAFTAHLVMETVLPEDAIISNNRFREFGQEDLIIGYDVQPNPNAFSTVAAFDTAYAFASDNSTLE
ncbi:MAG: right-handed parallel beta-helix repeat-containing protein, partial [Spirochaetaceae bacterium]